LPSQITHYSVWIPDFREWEEFDIFIPAMSERFEVVYPVEPIFYLKIFINTHIVQSMNFEPMNHMPSFESLIGKTLKSIHGGYPLDKPDSLPLLHQHNFLIFTTEDNENYLLSPQKDHDEDVFIDGNLSGLIGSPLLKAEEWYTVNIEKIRDPRTVTFYHLATEKSQILIKWIVYSNSELSTKVHFRKLTPENMADIYVPHRLA